MSAPGQPFLFGIDTPTPLRPEPNGFSFEGWCFRPDQAGAGDVRLVVDDRIFPARGHLRRSDVSRDHPGQPQAAFSGFRITGRLPFGLHVGRLESRIGGDAWLFVRFLAIPVLPPALRGKIEKPEGMDAITTPARVQGWCFHPEFALRELTLRYGRVEVPCESGGERADVARLFPAHPAAARAGFITRENLPRGAGKLSLRAVTSCGRVYFLRTDRKVAIARGAEPKPPARPPRPRHAALPAPAGGATPRRTASGPASPESPNVLFALYGDFSSNSALHVVGLARELCALGLDCAVAVPKDKESLAYHRDTPFLALNFDELPGLAAVYRDGRGPGLIHAWTTRENVRRFCTQARQAHGSRLFVHLEDNEHELLESRLGRRWGELRAMPPAALDPLVPGDLSHPRHAEEFLRSADGATVILDRLREHVPAGLAAETLWPATDARHFYPRPVNHALRARLGLSPEDVVLFYHGNVHASNAAEVRELYLATALLNEGGRRAQLVRAGDDAVDFLGADAARVRPHVISLGRINHHHHLPALMALTDFFVQPGAPGPFNDYRFPSKLPDFFALGRPVILPRTNVGLVTRHLSDAYVLPAADAPAIAHAVRELRAKPALAAALAEGAARFAREHFSWRKSAEKLLGFYRARSAVR